MSFVQDHDRVAQKQWIADRLSQQHAVSHELQLGLWGCSVLEPYSVAHLWNTVYVAKINCSKWYQICTSGFSTHQFSKLAPLFLGHSSSQRDGSHTPRLCDCDDALTTDASFIKVLRDLCGLPRTGLS